MRLKKQIFMAAVLSIPCTGCYKPEFEGKIQDDEVKFYQYNIYNRELIVKKSDGRKISYEERDNDGKLDYIAIQEGKRKVRYDRDNSAHALVFEEGQRKFDEYLKEIQETKRRDLLEKF